MGDENSEQDKVGDAIAQGEAPMGELMIQKVYVKDLSFEAPNVPEVFNQEWKPQIDIQFQSGGTPLANDLREVVLSATVTVRFEDKTVYLVEVQQAGLFKMAGFPEEIIRQMLVTVCPNILFPFIRETISDTVIRGGFPQLLLAPVNFEHLHAQEAKRKREAQHGKTH